MQKQEKLIDKTDNAQQNRNTKRPARTWMVAFTRDVHRTPTSGTSPNNNARPWQCVKLHLRHERRDGITNGQTPGIVFGVF